MIGNRRNRGNLYGNQSFIKLSQRDAHPLAFRKERVQLFFVAETGKTYHLVGGITNSHWEIYNKTTKRYFERPSTVTEPNGELYLSDMAQDVRIVGLIIAVEDARTKAEHDAGAAPYSLTFQFVGGTTNAHLQEFGGAADFSKLKGQPTDNEALATEFGKKFDKAGGVIVGDGHFEKEVKEAYSPYLNFWGTLIDALGAERRGNIRVRYQNTGDKNSHLSFFDASGTFLMWIRENGEVGIPIRLTAPLMQGSKIDFGSGDGTGIKWWNSEHYKISYSNVNAVDSGAGGRLDAVSDYNMYFSNGGGAGRGFVFKHQGNPVAQIDGYGKLYLKGDDILIGADQKSLKSLISHRVYFEVNPDLATYPILLMDGSATDLAEVLGRGITSCTYDVRLLSTTTWTTGNTIAAVQTWLTNNAITTEKWEIRAVPVFDAAHTGETQVILKFSK
jgi:hypothetical protein